MIRFTVCAAVLSLAAACEERTNSVTPEAAAQKFADDLGYRLQGKPSCTGVDTDDDGYVTCTLAILDRPDSAPRILSLQCAGVTGSSAGHGQTTKYATGCKQTEPKAVVQKQEQ